MSGVVTFLFLSLVLVGLARLEALFEGGTLRLKISYRIGLALDGLVELADDSLFKFVELVELLLVLLLLQRMFSTHGLIGTQNCIHVTVFIVLALEDGVLVLLV